MKTIELRQSLGLIALSNFARQGSTQLDQSKQALRTGSGSVIGVDQDGQQFQVLRFGEAAGLPEQVEALDSDGRWRIATALVIVE